MSCECPRPRPGDATGNRPRGGESCVICGRVIDPGIRTERIQDLLDQLEETDGINHESFQPFRQLCEAREEAGRDSFGLVYLTKDNLLDAAEEFADGANYVLFDVLLARRQGDDPELALALTVAYHAYRAFEALAHLRGRQRGEP